MALGAQHKDMAPSPLAMTVSPVPGELQQRIGVGGMAAVYACRSGGLERLEWTAPEARAGAGWTEKSDVYSLGLLLYRLLTGRRPFVGASPDMIDPRSAAPACPPALATALRWALARTRVNASTRRDSSCSSARRARSCAGRLT